MFAAPAFVYAAAAISTAATVAGLYETALSGQSQLEQISIQNKQRELQMTQKKASVYSETEKVLDRQIAQSTVSGITLDSPSFNAIQRETMNISSKNIQNINTEEEFNEYNTKAEKENVRRTTYARLFGESASAGVSFATLKGS